MAGVILPGPGQVLLGQASGPDVQPVHREHEMFIWLHRAQDGPFYHGLCLGPMLPRRNDSTQQMQFSRCYVRPDGSLLLLPFYGFPADASWRLMEPTAASSS